MGPRTFNVTDIIPKILPYYTNTKYLVQILQNINMSHQK